MSELWGISNLGRGLDDHVPDVGFINELKTKMSSTVHGSLYAIEYLHVIVTWMVFGINILKWSVMNMLNSTWLAWTGKKI